MQETRKIVYYPDVKLPDLDAGVCIAYPLPNGNHKGSISFWQIQGEGKF